MNTDAADSAVAARLAEEFDAVVVAAGACAARGVRAEGFEEGLASGDVVYAVDYLTEQTRALLEGREPAISAEGKDVVVIGGGDTGNDCMGTAVRQGCAHGAPAGVWPVRARGARGVERVARMAQREEDGLRPGGGYCASRR